MSTDEKAESWKVSPPSPEYFESLSWEEFTKQLGRQLAIARRRVPGECVVCGTPFIGTTKRKFCSHRCAAADSRKRLSESKKRNDGSDSGV